MNLKQIMGKSARRVKDDKFDDVTGEVETYMGTGGDVFFPYEQSDPKHGEWLRSNKNRFQKHFSGRGISTTEKEMNGKNGLYFSRMGDSRRVKDDTNTQSKWVRIRKIVDRGNIPIEKVANLAFYEGYERELNEFVSTVRWTIGELTDKYGYDIICECIAGAGKSGDYSIAIKDKSGEVEWYIGFDIIDVPSDAVADEITNLING